MAKSSVQNDYFPISRGVTITQPTDFNSLTRAGIYSYESNSTVQNSANRPSNLAGILYVVAINGIDIGDVWGVGVQIYLDYFGEFLLRKASTDGNGNTAFGPWHGITA